MKNNISKTVFRISAIFALAIAFSGNAFSQSNSDDSMIGWTPELSMQFRRIQGTAISPDGEYIAYVVNTPLMEGSDSEFQTHIWIATADGSRNTQYTRGNFSASAPAFSPDSEHLSFISKRGEGDSAKSQVWVMPLFGGEARQLTDAENNVSAYKWSPSGDRIAFFMQDPFSEEREREIEEKRDVILVDQQPRFSHLHVVPMSDRISKSSKSVQITAGELVVGDFSWSPDGEEIVFSHKPTADLNVANQHGDISIVTVPSSSSIIEASANDGTDIEEPKELLHLGQVRSLVAGNGVESSPFWSPDGN